MMEDQNEPVDIGANNKSGKYMNFMLGGEYFGVELAKVREINGLMKITGIPNAPDFVRGVINLRGKIIPVIDLRVRFHLASHEDTDRTCIIVMQAVRDRQPVTMGMIVDEVCEVVNLTDEQMEPAPELGSLDGKSSITGIGKSGDKVILLFDVDQLMNMDAFPAEVGAELPMAG